MLEIRNKRIRSKERACRRIEKNIIIMPERPRQKHDTVSAGSHVPNPIRDIRSKIVQDISRLCIINNVCPSEASEQSRAITIQFEYPRGRDRKFAKQRSGIRIVERSKRRVVRTGDLKCYDIAITTDRNGACRAIYDPTKAIVPSNAVGAEAEHTIEWGSTRVRRIGLSRIPATAAGTREGHSKDTESNTESEMMRARTKYHDKRDKLIQPSDSKKENSVR
jgi:hypothetical protein